MFNVGGGEILVILVIALIVLGPDKLPNAARQAGKYLHEFRRISSGFQDEIRGAMDLAGSSPDPTPVQMDPAEPAEPGIVSETVAMSGGEPSTTFEGTADTVDTGLLAETVAMTDGEQDDDPATDRASDLPSMRAAATPTKVGPSTDVAEAELAVTQAKLAAAQAELAEAEARLAEARTVAGTEPSNAAPLDPANDAGSVPPDSTRA